MGVKHISRKIFVTVILALLLASTFLASASTKTNANAQVNTSGNTLTQYEWSQFQGDSAFSRFSAGPAPDKSAILWKANVAGIQPYITAFNGMIYVCTNSSVLALDRETGNTIWQTVIPVINNLTHSWPVAYKIDDSHMIVESTCLDPASGNILWTSRQFSADTGGIFNLNVYSPEEKMFYTKVASEVVAWDFSNPSNPPTKGWTAFVRGGGTTGSGITYGGGMVFPGSFECQQIALDAKTGAVVWDTPTKAPMIFEGSYSDGRFLRGGTDDNTLYCFNATNGNVIWTYIPPTDGYFATGTAVGYGMVYALNKDGSLYAVNIETGILVWSYKGPGPLLFPGNPTVADGKVYATTGQETQYHGLVGASEFACVNAFTGRLLPLEALAPRESVAIAYGHLYFIPGSVTAAVDTISGNEYATINEVWAIGSTSIPNSSWTMWRADPTHSSTAQVGPSNLSLSWKFATNGAVISSPSISNGIVYFGSQDKNIYAVGAWGGNLIWKFATKVAIESSPAVVDGRVFTGGDDGYVYCLDAYTGALIWKTFVNGDLPYSFGTIVLKSSPTVSGGVVYIGSLDGYLYALNTNDGHVVWNYNTNGQIESTPAVHNGAVFFTSQEPNNGVLYKLDAATGGLIWKFPIPY